MWLATVLAAPASRPSPTGGLRPALTPAPSCTWGRSVSPPSPNGVSANTTRRHLKLRSGCAASVGRGSVDGASCRGNKLGWRLGSGSACSIPSFLGVCMAHLGQGACIRYPCRRRPIGLEIGHRPRLGPRAQTFVMAAGRARLRWDSGSSVPSRLGRDVAGARRRCMVCRPGRRPAARQGCTSPRFESPRQGGSVSG